MLAQLRGLAKSPIFTVLIAILLASFLLWGIRDVFRYSGPSGDAVIQAGSRSVSSARFQRMFQDELRSYTQQTGQTVTAQDALKANLDRQMVDGVASDEAFAELLQRMGVRPSDKLIVDEIRKAPRFFNPVSGVFDRQAYAQFVQGQLGMTDAEFEGVLRDEQAQNQFVAGLAAGLRPPLIYDALVAASQGEGRTFSYFVLPPGAVPPAAKPTDAQLTSFVKENAERLRRPEMRVLTVLKFSTAALAPTLQVDPVAVQKRFAFEKDALSTPEKRTVVQIPVRSASDAATASARLKRGEDPTAVAHSLGVQPILYTDQPKTAIADRKVADAAFALKAGETSGAVQGDLGLAVLKVTAVQPGHVATLQDAQSKIEDEVRKSAAQAKIDEQVRKYEDARSGGANLIEAARQVGVTPTTAGPVTAQGANGLGQPVGVDPKLLQTAFSLPAGGDSEIIDQGGGEYAAVRVEKIVPPSVPGIDEIRPQLTQYWMMRDVETRLQAKANALADRIRKGMTVQAAAASAGVAAQHGADVMRSATGQTYSQQVLAQLFNSKPGEVVVGPDVHPGAAVVAKLEAVVPASGPAAAQLAANQQPNMSRSLMQDFGQAVRTAARDIVKPKLDYRRARAAVGGDAGAGS